LLKKTLIEKKLCRSHFVIMRNLIEVSDVRRSYGKHKVLDGISLAVTSGSVYGLVGLNGAGKTTFLRILLGILKPDSGIVTVAGMEPWFHSSSFYSKLGVVLEHDGFWGNLTIKENLKIFSAAKQLSWSDTQQYIEQFWNDTVITRSAKKVRQLSRGQRMQCALCRAFLGWPEVVLLDEPAIALDMTAYSHFGSIVRHARSSGAAIIISSHQLDTIDDLCDRVGNLSDGVINDLKCHDENGFYKWVMATDSTAQVFDLLLSHGCTDIHNVNGRWTFSVDHPERRIPLIVREMVETKYPVYEIRQEVSGFSDTIRSIYHSVIHERK